MITNFLGNNLRHNQFAIVCYKHINIVHRSVNQNSMVHSFCPSDFKKRHWNLLHSKHRVSLKRMQPPLFPLGFLAKEMAAAGNLASVKLHPKAHFHHG